MWNALLLAATLFQAPAPAPTTAFVGATVLPMDSERRLEDHTVVVRDGRIVAVGPRASTPVPEGALTIDGSGRFLMPGLVDMHVHTWAASDAPMFLAHGVTTVRNLFGNPQHLALRARIEKGELVAPTLVTAGPILDGEPPVWPGSFVVEDVDSARAAVEAHVEQGYDFLKVYNRLPLEAYEAIVAEARLAGLAVDGHTPDAVGYARVLAAGQRTVEHMSGIGLVVAAGTPGTGWVGDNLGWGRVDPELQKLWVERSVAAGVWLCPTFVVFQKMLEPDLFARELGMEHVRHVPLVTRQFWKSMNERNTPEGRAAGRDSVPPRMAFLEAFVDSGGRVILGTDMGNPLVVPGYSVHEELANFAAAGLTPFQALASATRSPAECLGLAQEFGTVAVGTRADLLLLEADPLLDVDNARDLQGVMVRGRWLDRAALDASLAALLQPAPAVESED
jgi:imidazolonepropionase-like amidohydrolase